MFDESKQPVDIFETVEKPAGASSSQGAVPQAPTQPARPERVVRRGPSVLVFLVVLILLGTIGGGVWYFFFREKATEPVVDVPAQVPPVNVAPSQQQLVPIVNEPAPQPIVTDPAPQPVVEARPVIDPTPAPIDSDGDGLSDGEEMAAGTNVRNADSDNDGLTDREEIAVYATDALIVDTDGDGYGDGAEVKGGYDPKGPGKLLNVPTGN